MQDPLAAQTAYNSKFIETTFLWENSRSTYESAEKQSYNPAKNLGRWAVWAHLGIWVAQFFQARDKVRQYYTIFARASTWFFLVIHTYCQAPLTVEIFLPKKKYFIAQKKQKVFYSYLISAHTFFDPSSKKCIWSLILSLWPWTTVYSFFKLLHKIVQDNSNTISLWIPHIWVQRIHRTTLFVFETMLFEQK